MPDIHIYTTRWCGFSRRAKALLDERGIDYDEIPLDEEVGFRRKLLDETGGFTVPQILVVGRPIGGYSELLQLDREGRLEDLVQAA